jgi:hypothetical protein
MTACGSQELDAEGLRILCVFGPAGAGETVRMGGNGGQVMIRTHGTPPNLKLNDFNGLDISRNGVQAGNSTEICTDCRSSGLSLPRTRPLTGGNLQSIAHPGDHPLRSIRTSGGKHCQCGSNAGWQQSSRRTSLANRRFAGCMSSRRAGVGTGRRRTACDARTA